jgi:hypothetical protein
MPGIKKILKDPILEDWELESRKHIYINKIKNEGIDNDVSWEFRK